MLYWSYLKFWAGKYACCVDRTCLRYFLPPQWIMDKDAVSALSTPDLVQFPLDDFFDHYEKGLRKVAFSLLFFSVCV